MAPDVSVASVTVSVSSTGPSCGVNVTLAARSITGYDAEVTLESAHSTSSLIAMAFKYPVVSMESNTTGPVYNVDAEVGVSPWTVV